MIHVDAAGLRLSTWVSRHRLLRGFARSIAWSFGIGVSLSIVAVLSLRFVAPLTSAVMLEDWLGAKLRADRNFILHYRWIPWDHVSKTLPIALVAAEDQKFPFHHGFDFDAIHNAIAEADEGERLRGASTISQQVAKNLFLWNGRSFVRKGLEAYFTVLIEALWPKRRILEVYLNIAQFGEGVYGAAAASERFFHAAPTQLDAHQAALLAAVLPNPLHFRVDRPTAYVQRRAGWIQRQANHLGGADYLPR